jgi:hypothetical protein
MTPLPEIINEKKLDLPLPDRWYASVRFGHSVGANRKYQCLANIMMASSTNTWSVNDLTANFELPQATIMIQHRNGIVSLRTGTA